MPQLVKGGKYVYGWTAISQTGFVNIPPEAVKDYEIKPDEIVVLMPGSKRSGGFSVIPKRNIKEEAPFDPFKAHAEDKVQLPNSRLFFIARIEDGGVYLPFEVLEAFGLGEGDKLLAVRGSGLGPSFLAKGPLKDVALNYPELVNCARYHRD